MKSVLEETLAMQLKALRLDFGMQREVRFAPPRMFRFDFAWERQMVAVEVDGGLYSGGRHTRGSGYEKDCEKGNLALLMGWRVFHFTAKAIKSGTAAQTIAAALGMEWTGRGYEMRVL